MKKLIILLVITTTCFIACNDPKDPPDDVMTVKIQAHADSLARLDSLQQLK